MSLFFRSHPFTVVCAHTRRKGHMSYYPPYAGGGQPPQRPPPAQAPPLAQQVREERGETAQPMVGPSHSLDRHNRATVSQGAASAAPWLSLGQTHTKQAREWSPFWFWFGLMIFADPLFSSPPQYYHQPPPAAPYAGNGTSGHYGGGGGGYPAAQAAPPQYAPPPPHHHHHPYAPYTGQAPPPQQHAYAAVPPQSYAPPAAAAPPPYHPAHYAPPHQRYDDDGWRQPASPPRAPARVPYGSAARPAEGPPPPRHRASPPPPRVGGRAAGLLLASSSAPPPAEKAAPVKRRASPPREAAVVTQPAVRGPLLAARRDWSEVVSLYPRLMVGPAFASVTTPLAVRLLPPRPGASLLRELPPSLARGGVGGTLVDGGFAAAPRYEHTHDLPGPPAADAPDPPASVQPTPTEGGASPHTTFHVRVALPVGGFDVPTTPAAPHTFKAVRFVTVRREQPVADGGDGDAAPQPSTIQLPGGAVDPTLDGEVASVADGDDAPLISAALRHCAAQLGLDLAPCTGWTRVCEAVFQRAPGDTLDIFVTLLPDASPCVPSGDAWDAAWAARCAFGRARAAVAAAVADGGDPASAAAAAADGEPGEASPPPPDDAAIVLRGRRWSDGSLWRSASVSLHGLLDYDTGDRDEGTAVLSLFAETVADALTWEAGVRVAVFAGGAVDGAADKKRKRGSCAAAADLAAAFRLVTRGGRGVLRADDLRRLLHGLGYGASHRAVKDVVRAAVVRSGGRSGEVVWSKLVKLVE